LLSILAFSKAPRLVVPAAAALSSALVSSALVFADLAFGLAALSSDEESEGVAPDGSSVSCFTPFYINS
jgi:hypothetical protein